MKKCPNCHKLNNKNAKFCKYCGHKLPKETNVNNVQSKDYIICPNCGKKNTKSAKFCLNCGYNLKTKQINQKPIINNKMVDKHNNTNIQSNTNKNKNITNAKKKSNREQYQKEWHHANKTIQSVSKHSNNYFLWLKECFKQPTGKHISNPYFGFITFGIQALLLFLIMMIGGHSEFIGNSIHSIVGYLPIQTYWNYYGNIFTPLALIICVILFYLSYILIGLLVNLIFSKSTIELNLLQCTNKLASISTPAIIILLLLFVVAIVGSEPLVEIFATITLITYYVGLTIFIAKQKTNINTLYISIGAIFIWYLIKGLIATALVLVI